MKYSNIEKGIFISRPNRFIANVLVNGRMEQAHVKNTGRCRELLVEGAVVYLQHHDNDVRRTKWSLINVVKGNRLVNIDSQAPNKVVLECLKKWQSQGGCILPGQFLGNIENIRPEFTCGESRIDFMVEAQSDRVLIEVKGVTLEEDNVAMFPDAPTERGIRHMEELSKSLDYGFKAYVIFVVQMEGVRYFTPNIRTHKAFGDALKQAVEKGVRAMAVDCVVGEDFLSIKNEVAVML